MFSFENTQVWEEVNAAFTSVTVFWLRRWIKMKFLLNVYTCKIGCGLWAEGPSSVAVITTEMYELDFLTMWAREVRGICD